MTTTLGPSDAAGRTPRYGQLTYTSFDGRGVGGWQVKEQRGLSEGEQELLRLRIDPQLDTGTELPRFPSPDDVERFPRRLVFAPRPLRTDGDALALRDDRAVAWWHHASAGLDGSGRPGNVFAHVLLDRYPTNERPIDLWRSPGWLTPWGPDEVLAATLGSGPPGPGAMISPQDLAAFLLDLSHYRLGVLSVLLDACAAAVDGGPPVVLATESTDSAARWVAAVTYLMSPAAAVSFGFSTLERFASLTSRFAFDLPLCCVPRSDYEGLLDSERTFILLAEDEGAAIGDLDGEPHVTGAGDRVTVTEWSVLAKVVLLDEPTAVWALTQLDAVARQIEDFPDPCPELAWPLAMVVAGAPEHFSDAIGEATRVLIRRTPAALRSSADLLESARSMIEDGLGPSTRDAWDPLNRVLAPGEPLTVVAEMLLGIYVRRAVVDQEWLTRPDGAPVPRALWSSGSRPAEVEGALSATVTALLQADPADRSAARTLAALTNFAVQLGLLTPELLDRVSGGLEGSFVHLLFAPDADELVAVLGRFDERTLEVVLRPLVNNVIGLEPRPVGQRLTVGVANWLYADDEPVLVPRPNQPYEEFRLRAELAVQRVQRVQPGQTSHPGERPLAAIALLAEGADSAAVESLFATPVWSVHEVSAIESRFPGQLPLELFAPTFKATASGAALDDLGRLVLSFRRNADGHDPHGPGELVRMRLSAGESWWTSEYRFLDQLAVVLSGAVHALKYADVPLHPDARDQTRAAMLLALVWGLVKPPVEGPSVDDVTTLVRADGRSGDVVSDALWQMLREGAWEQLSVEQLVVAALLGEPEFPEPRITDLRYRWAHQIRVDVEGVPVPVLRQCVALEIAEGEETLDALVDKVIGEFSTKLRRSFNPDRASRVVAKFAQSWLKPMFAGHGLLGRRR